MTVGQSDAPDAPPVSRRCAAALLVCRGRYLMQLRDAKPGIFLPDHWALFGGAIDPGEHPADAMVRELVEELEYRPRRVEPFSEMTVDLPFAAPRRDRLIFFVVPFDDTDLAVMVQHEGADKRLFTPGELAAETRVAPWDLAAVLMHARRTALFGR
jgi:8-oxo-dGTP pyrophosphatase MutT (NUDIX family)